MDYVVEVLGSDGSSFALSLVSDPFIIGRSAEAQLVINSPLVSRNHAKLYVISGNLYIEDLNSTNGTHLNGKPLQGRTTFRPGDVVAIGETRITVKMHSAMDNDHTLLMDEGAKPRGPADFVDRFGLSKREAEILFYLVDGKSPADIADGLCISPGTVKNHILSIYRKTETHSRVELLALYLRQEE